MSRGWRFNSGDWIVSCDVCSKQIRASEAKKRWDGLIVCSADFEQRHPQDLLRVRQERIGVPFTRLEPPDVFVDVGYIDIYMDEEYVVDDYVWEGFPLYYFSDLGYFDRFNYIAEEHL